MGEHNGGVIRRSSATGPVTGGTYVGGLVGDNRTKYAAEERPSPIETSYATGAVTGEDCVGGLVGRNCDDVVDCYATGSVTATGDVGGLVGRNLADSRSLYPGTIDRSYAIGTLEWADDESVGGLVGTNADVDDEEVTVGDVIDAYWGVAETGLVTSAGSPDADALETESMTGSEAAEAFEGFDFRRTWTTTETYPALSWQEDPDEAFADVTTTDERFEATYPEAEFVDYDTDEDTADGESEAETTDEETNDASDETEAETSDSTDSDEDETESDDDGVRDPASPVRS